MEINFAQEEVTIAHSLALDAESHILADLYTSGLLFVGGWFDLCTWYGHYHDATVIEGI